MPLPIHPANPRRAALADGPLSVRKGQCSWANKGKVSGEEKGIHHYDNHFFVFDLCKFFTKPHLHSYKKTIMVFGLFNFKRKFFSIEESNDTTTSKAIEDNGSPTKRARVEELTHQVRDLQPSTVRGASTEDNEDEEFEVCFEIIPRNNKGKEKERIEELEEEIRETREITARLLQETRDILECGHTACYPCLRSWFTRSKDGLNRAPIISTDEESDEDEKPHPGPSNPAPAPAPTRPRHHFHSAVNRKKTCPECQIAISHRPLPLYRLRHLGDVMNGSESPVPSFLQPRRKPHRLSKRKDLWHGIFHPIEESKPTKNKYRFIVENPGPVEDQGPGPILEHWAQAQVRRDAALERVRWQAAIDEAREEGRRQVIWEQQRERERLEEQRRRRQSYTVADMRFWNPPFREMDGQRRDIAPVRYRVPSGKIIFPREQVGHPAIPPPAPAPDIIPIVPPSSEPTAIPQPPAQSRTPSPVPPSEEFVTGSSASSIVEHPARPVFLGPPPSEAGPSRSIQPENSSQTSSSSAVPIEEPTASTSNSSTRSPTVLEAIRKIRQQYNHSRSSQDIEQDADELDDGDSDLPLFQAMFRNPTPPPAPESDRLYPVYVEELKLEDTPQPEQQTQRDLPVIIFEDHDDGGVGSFARRAIRNPTLPDDVEEEEEEEEEDPAERLERLVREGEASDLDG
ncbi:hypothetical protein Clacol_007758 [Clathrus columnatus]|uniref:RING-type domain-containing protein n=1 Tax=Clathrus columnatus TaxID=1419009 RepID=A0AAV5AK57_9AGAM|nr:hypothetical protein Clacol_007758 [Clathrus columnatus]